MKANNTINILGLAVILGLSLLGCADKTNPEGSSDISDNSPGTSVSENIVNSSNSSAESTESTTPESGYILTDKMKGEIVKDSFVGPDGETVRLSDAADIFDTSVRRPEGGSPAVNYYNGTCITDDPDNTWVSTVARYNFAYIRYCRPFFYAGDVLNETERDEMRDALPEVEWFKVKPGDNLDCGLTVKTALYERFPVPDNYQTLVRDNYVEFDGEITVEGILYTAQNPRDYLTQPGDLVFVPDPTKTKGLPAGGDFAFDKYNYNIFISMGNGDIKYVMADIGINGWLIGKADDIDAGEIFGNDEFVPVKATLKNLRYGGVKNIDMPAMYAEIVDIERVERT